MSVYSRGSEWRKWDLHIHSNASDGQCSPSEIIEEAQKKELSVIALTDHHTIKNLDEIKDLGRKNGIEVISGIEFRTEYGARSVHMIGLFPTQHNGTELTQTALHDLILSPLGLSETSIITKGRETDPKLKDFDAFKAGMFRVQVDFKKAADLIHKHGGIVTVHAGNKTNSIEEMKHDGVGITNVDSLGDSLGPVKEELLSVYIDICEVNKCCESDFYFRMFGRPSIAASDAHNKGEVGRKYSWIKANPSFDGLIQIKYEPDTRVRIQEEEPDRKANYVVIDHVEIQNPLFSDTNVPTRIWLNPNLNCIIGGRSTGKSLLLNNIAYAIDGEQVIQKYEMTQPENKRKGSDKRFTPFDGFVVHWSDGHTSSFSQHSMKKIVYIPQTYLNRLSDEKEETTEVDELIRQILSQDEDTKARFEASQITLEILKKDTDKFIYDYIDGLKRMKNAQAQLLANNDSNTIRKEILKLEQERKKYTSGTAISEEQSKNYSIWSEELQTLNLEQSYLMHDKEVLGGIKHLLIEKPIEFKGLQSFIKAMLETSIAGLEKEMNESWEAQRGTLTSTIGSRLKDIDTRRETLTKSIEALRPIIESNASFVAISEKIVKEKGKLQEAQRIETDISEQQKAMSALLSLLVHNVTKFHDVMSAYTKYVNEEKNLKIEGLEFNLEVVLRTEALKNRLLEVLNNKTLSRFKDIMDIPQFCAACYNEDLLSQLERVR
ncbi:MAG: PHP domain-containing protein [Clostridia bacterium]